MLFVIAAALSITCLSLIMRYSTTQTETLWGVILGNYLTAAGIMALFVVSNGSGNVSVFTLGLGAVTGLTYAAGMYLNLTLMGKRGAAITSSMIQLAVLIPIGVSVFFYGETISSTQLIGIILAVSSLPLLAAKPMERLDLDRKVIPMILLAITVVGFSQLSSKILVQSGLEAQNNYFFLAIFSSAALLVSPLVWRNRAGIRRRDGLFGMGVGMFNVAANRFLLLALTTLPGAIVFPVSSAGSLLLVSISAIVLFKERVSRVNLAGILLTLAAVILINL